LLELRGRRVTNRRRDHRRAARNFAPPLIQTAARFFTPSALLSFATTQPDL
jgi:hypothetical protein